MQRAVLALAFSFLGGSVPRRRVRRWDPPKYRDGDGRRTSTGCARRLPTRTDRSMLIFVC